MRRVASDVDQQVHVNPDSRASCQFTRRERESGDADAENFVLQEKKGDPSEATRARRRKILCFEG